MTSPPISVPRSASAVIDGILAVLAIVLLAVVVLAS